MIRFGAIRMKIRICSKSSISILCVPCDLGGGYLFWGGNLDDAGSAVMKAQTNSKAGRRCFHAEHAAFAERSGNLCCYYPSLFFNLIEVYLDIKYKFQGFILLPSFFSLRSLRARRGYLFWGGNLDDAGLAVMKAQTNSNHTPG